MRHLAGTLLLIVLSFNIKAQSPNYLESYYPHIHSAEIFIIEDDYYHALQQFEIAFEKTKNGQLKDYFNAAVCATYLGDANKTYNYLEKLASKGLSLDFLKNEVAFKGIQRDPNWREFELKYLELKRNFEQSIDGEYLRILDILTARGNYFREKNAETFADTIVTIDAENAIILDSLIRAKGFPSEEEIGIGKGGYPNIEYPFYELIKRQTPESQTIDFSNKVITAVRNGKITPHLASQLLRHTTGNDALFSRHLFMIKMDESIAQETPINANKWVYTQLNEEDERRFNELRLNFGLETLADYRRKILFSLQDHRFLLPYKIFTAMWFVRDKDLAEQYLENTIIAN